MTVNPSSFHLLNVADTCSVWNLLSSRLLYARACEARCAFCCTAFVHYECLNRARTKLTAEDDELKTRLRNEITRGQFKSYHVELADLLEIGFLENRNRLSRGEITSIAFAKETQQAFLTDDQRARKLASQIMDPSLVQTTPQLFGWLYFTNLLFDSDKAAIISEHQAFRRPLAPHFEAMYAKALEYRLREQGT